MLSSRMHTRKQLLSWGRGVPPLNSVGEACVNQRSDMAWYVEMAESMSSCRGHGWHGQLGRAQLQNQRRFGVYLPTIAGKSTNQGRALYGISQAHAQCTPRCPHLVDAHGHAHEHVLRPLHHLAVDAQQVGALQRLEAKVVVVKVAVVADLAVQPLRVLCNARESKTQ